MALKVSASDGVKVYNVTSGKTQPEWLAEGKKKSLKKNEEYRRRLELIQDFEFPAAAHKIKATSDGNFIYATGIHPPRIRCFETGQLSMKFERHLDSEIVDFQILSEDYSKAAFLCADRCIAFHAKYGAHHKTRVPKFGRDMAYYPYTADLLVAASSNEIYRLNLEEGMFQEPLASKSPGINKLAISPVHGLIGAAGEEGLLECFDMRQEQCAGRFDASQAMGCVNEALTALQFDDTGLKCAVGTHNGQIAIYDLRSSRPLVQKDHMYSSPILSLAFFSTDFTGGLSGRDIVSADKHIVRIWDAESGKGITSIQPDQGPVNDVLVWPNSGLLMMACDAPKIQAHFIPSIGPAPKWCAFLESLTEEMEENVVPTIYDDYRFVTRAELEKLGMAHLIGSSLLRAYMHGFFVHNKLYQKARAITEPTDFSTLRKQRIQSKLDEAREQRITLKRKLPKVNATLAAKLLSEDGKEAPNKKAKTGQTQLLEDDRFKDMFQDPAFTIDETAEEYRILHPNADRKRDKRLVQEHFEDLEDGTESEEENDLSQSDQGDSDEDLFQNGPSKSVAIEKPSLQNQRNQFKPAVKLKENKPRMLVAKSEQSAKAFQKRESLKALQGLPLAERAERAVLNHGKEGFRIGGQREVTFHPRGRGRGRRGRGGGREGGRMGGRGGGREGKSFSERPSGFSQGRGRGGGRSRGRSRGRY